MQPGLLLLLLLLLLRVVLHEPLLLALHGASAAAAAAAAVALLLLLLLLLLALLLLALLLAVRGGGGLARGRGRGRRVGALRPRRLLRLWRRPRGALARQRGRLLLRLGARRQLLRVVQLAVRQQPLERHAGVQEPVAQRRHAALAAADAPPQRRVPVVFDGVVRAVRQELGERGPLVGVRRLRLHDDGLLPLAEGAAADARAQLVVPPQPAALGRAAGDAVGDDDPRLCAILEHARREAAVLLK